MQRRIAIAGAGIGGLALAAALARAGHSVCVFDQFDRARPVGSGLVVQPVGLRVLEELGAGEAALAMGNRIHRMLGSEADSGRTVLDVSYDAPGNPRFGLAIHRAALFQTLLDRALAAGADVMPGHRVTGREGLHLLFGTQGEGPFDVIVDAAGSGSPLSPMQARPLAYGALWATVGWPDGTDLPRNELRQTYRRADRMLGVLPVGHVPGQEGFRTAIFWSLPATGYESWQSRGIHAWQDEALRLWPAFEPFAAQITDAGQMTMARYAHGTLRKPYSDGVVYLGDAAHRASPQLGQGANMALLDAWAFAQAFEKARGDAALAALWYAQARRWHVRSYQLMSRLFTPQYQSDSRVLPVLRDRLLAPLASTRPLADLLTRLVCGDLVPPMASLQV
jgi:2-polyprenyl-6-methoxyphenol hydroxylase-like FAD-dependent oxidoreductase